MSRGWGKRGSRERRGPKVYQVAEVNAAARRFLEEKFSDFWVEAEVSQAKRSASGHLYFTLSDERHKAQLQAVMFARDVAQSRLRIEAGARVRVRGQISLYEAAGRFQMIVRQALPAGEGDLQARFEAIRRKLRAEGLLDPERKRALPRLPRAVGVVTSAQSAALRDIVRVAHARAPVPLIVAHCQVQGQGSARSIVEALARIVQVPEVDVVVLGRGGGAAEELWAFNAEPVARAVAACPVPVVCGVGHETDVTIAELVADVRASTPSNAAELAVPEREVLARELEALLRNLQRALDDRVRAQRRRLEWLQGRLERPAARLARAGAALHTKEHALHTAARDAIGRGRSQVDRLEAQVREHDPRVRLARDRSALDGLVARLRRAAEREVQRQTRRVERLAAELDARPALEGARHRLGRSASQLHALSPLQVLERGYAIAFDAEGKAVRRAQDVEVGSQLRVRLHEGTLRATVTERDDD